MKASIAKKINLASKVDSLPALAEKLVNMEDARILHIKENSLGFAAQVAAGSYSSIARVNKDRTRFNAKTPKEAVEKALKKLLRGSDEGHYHVVRMLKEFNLA